jgi:broad specificity phosphatase PhoE
MNAQRRVQGGLDSPLDAVGRSQAVALAWRLEPEEPRILYTSTLHRARETAELVAARLGVPIVTDERLIERDVGAIAGLTNEEMEVRFPEWVRQWRESDERVPPPGSEDPQAFRERVSTVFADIARRHPDDVVGVVTHGGVLGAYLCSLVGVSWRRHSPFSLGNASLSIVDLDGRRFRIRLLNDRCHLGEEAA